MHQNARRAKYLEQMLDSLLSVHGRDAANRCAGRGAGPLPAAGRRPQRPLPAGARTPLPQGRCVACKLPLYACPSSRAKFPLFVSQDLNPANSLKNASGVQDVVGQVGRLGGGRWGCRLGLFWGLPRRPLCRALASRAWRRGPI